MAGLGDRRGVNQEAIARCDDRVVRVAPEELTASISTVDPYTT